MIETMKVGASLSGTENSRRRMQEHRSATENTSRRMQEHRSATEQNHRHNAK